MKKRILLLSHNFSPEPTGIGKYNGEMMEWFSKKGYDTTVITTYPYYPYWKVQAPYIYSSKWYKKEIVKYPEVGTTMEIYRCPIYVPAVPSGKKRLLQDGLLWPSKLFALIKLIILKKRHDILITVAPPFHLAKLAFFYRALTKGKVVYHIQDMQIEAAQSLNFLKNEGLFKWLFKVERDILRKADFVSSISEGMVKKITEKCDRDVIFFPNWADTSFFYPVQNRDELKERWNFNRSDLVCIYSGSIGEKQGLESIIYAAEILRDLPSVKFVIAGSGPHKEKLLQMACEKNLRNIFFFPVQPKESFNAFLNMADLHLVIQKADASDLVMPSKLTTILAVGGVAVITAPENTSLHQVVSKHDVGFVCQPDSPVDLAGVISGCLSIDLSIKRSNSRDYALKYLCIDGVMEKFVSDIGL